MGIWIELLRKIVSLCKKIVFVPYADIQEIFYQNDFNWKVAPSDNTTSEFPTRQQRFLTPDENCGAIIIQQPPPVRVERPSTLRYTTFATIFRDATTKAK